MMDDLQYRGTRLNRLGMKHLRMIIEGYHPWDNAFGTLSYSSKLFTGDDSEYSSYCSPNDLFVLFAREVSKSRVWSLVIGLNVFLENLIAESHPTLPEIDRLAWDIR